MVLALISFSVAQAYDFKKNVGGNVLYFSVLQGDSTVSVVAPNGTDGYGSALCPEGRLTIPEWVQYDGSRYRVVAIGDKAFGGCSGLRAVTIPVSVSSVGIGAFSGCDSLRTLVLCCDSLARAYNAFIGCKALDSLVLAASVRVLPPFVFSELHSLGAIVFLCENPVSMKNVFFGCSAEALLTVGRGVCRIPDFAFYNFTGLAGVLYEDDGPNLTVIGQCSFVNCTGVPHLLVPENVTTLGMGAFAHCTPRSVTFRCALPPLSSGNAFFGVSQYTPVFVPCPSIALYYNSSVGRQFENIQYNGPCDGKNTGPEVVYVHDTVIIHDTVYLTETGKASVVDTPEKVEQGDDLSPEEDELQEDDEPYSAWIFIDGKILRISRARSLRGTGVRVFDEKGNLVVDEVIPQDQPSDNYYIKLPRRQRYFLRLDMGTPVLVDVPAQEIK